MEIVFYEKPGCSGNREQKRLLVAAGHHVEARDLLRVPWTGASLRAFFGELPVAAWFNRNAPAVVSGAVVPEKLTEDEALTLMLAEPILIRRPLMESDGRRVVGFDPVELADWLGLTAPDGLEQCAARRDESCLP